MKKNTERLTIKQWLRKQESIYTTQEIINLIDSIEQESVFSDEMKIPLGKDRESIKEIQSILKMAKTKAEIREGWSIYRRIVREFGGYISGDSSQRLSAYMERLWKEILGTFTDEPKRNSWAVIFRKK